MRWLTVILLAALLGLQWSLWFGEGSWRYVQELREVQRLQEIENETLLIRNRALEAEVEDLRSGSEAVEERARRDMGMIREDEVFFLPVDPPGGMGPGAGRDRD
ncbi:MAG: cell division protein FtsB [Thioalkalivibrio sp.]|nr:MAG: cell division protein FtsB [Thioalkalivibrio sp.]